MITNVYVDGFNLYYLAVKRFPKCKWLDLAKLSQALLPGHEINRIRYFTAIVDQRPDDPQQQRRQQIYLRALQTIPNLDIHYGQFRNRVKRLPLANPMPGLDKYVRVKTYEEKGTDVNIATHLMIDGYEGMCERALVISNDADLAFPIRTVRDRLNLPIGVVNPSINPGISPTPTSLKNTATFLRRIRPNTLISSQFPDTLTDDKGVFFKPPNWS